MAFIVIYDAYVLYPNTLRDLLIRIGQPAWGKPGRSTRSSGR